MESIRENVQRVRDRIAATLEETGRTGADVTVVAVTKTFPAAVVDEVVRAGVPDVGENRVQEWLGKKDAVTEPCAWHLVGHLQRNKVNKVVGLIHTLHSLDSVDLARAIDRAAAARGTTVRAFLQVNTSGEAAKSGVAPDAAIDVAGAILECPRIDLAGLMTIGPVTMDPAATRHCFAELRALRDRASRELEHPLPHLSMGMTGDFEIALTEGATVLRLGRVITGERTPRR